MSDDPGMAGLPDDGIFSEPPNYIALTIVILMSIVLLAWLTSSASPLQSYPGFAGKAGCGSTSHFCSVKEQLSLFATVPILTAMATIAFGLFLYYFAESIWGVGKQKGEEEHYG